MKAKVFVIISWFAIVIWVLFFGLGRACAWPY